MKVKKGKWDIVIIVDYWCHDQDFYEWLYSYTHYIKTILKATVAYVYYDITTVFKE